MYLSRLQLNPRNRSAQRDLADRYELHRTLMSGFDETRLLDWLRRKGELRGFSVDPLNVRVKWLGRISGKRRQQSWSAVQFDGLLIVIGQDFESILATGLGSAKAFGFGLLSIPYR